ncbi:MAG: HU family DNA-binding protein [Tannerellaceae bacterium]|jgi:predicted histone-like DNA-binding protein|nr:HU family DNA-binding protein [Tannerellaceae bacterium]
MAVKYTVTERSNPQNPKASKKWYAAAKSSGEKTLRSMGKQIAARSTVSPADTQAVLVALTEVLAEELAEGKIVRLGDFGAFQVSLGSEGSATEKEFSPSMIKSKKVVFRAGIDLREMLNNLTFEKTASDPKPAKPDVEGEL